MDDQAGEGPAGDGAAERPVGLAPRLGAGAAGIGAEQAARAVITRGRTRIAAALRIAAAGDGPGGPA